MNRTKEGFDPLEKRWGHFPLCPEFDVRPSWCICDRLEQVMDATRADMTWHQKVNAESAVALMTWRDELHAKVEALPRTAAFADSSGVRASLVWLDDVLATIDGGGNDAS